MLLFGASFFLLKNVKYNTIPPITASIADITIHIIPDAAFVAVVVEISAKSVPYV